MLTAPTPVTAALWLQILGSMAQRLASACRHTSSGPGVPHDPTDDDQPFAVDTCKEQCCRMCRPLAPVYTEFSTSQVQWEAPSDLKSGDWAATACTQASEGTQPL